MVFSYAFKKDLVIHFTLERPLISLFHLKNGKLMTNKVVHSMLRMFHLKCPFYLIVVMSKRKIIFINYFS